MVTTYFRQLADRGTDGRTEGASSRTPSLRSASLRPSTIQDERPHSRHFHHADVKEVLKEIFKDKKKGGGEANGSAAVEQQTHAEAARTRDLNGGAVNGVETSTGVHGNGESANGVETSAGVHGNGVDGNEAPQHEAVNGTAGIGKQEKQEPMILGRNPLELGKVIG